MKPSKLSAIGAFAGKMACIFALALGFSVTVPVEPSKAQTNQCAALKKRLRAIPTSFSPSAADIKNKRDYQKANDLVRRQSRAMDAAKRDFRGYNCFAGGPASICRPLGQKIQRMDANLERLVKARNRLAKRSGSDNKKAAALSERRKIKRKIQQLGCHEPAARNRVVAASERKRPGFFERLFGRISRPSRYSNREDRTLREQPQPKREQRSYAVVRTMCVRVCDGYYFPVNFATTEASFSADAAICQASNTNTEMRLFYHLNPSETAEDMVDLEGRPYVDLPNAFRHRREFVGPTVCPAPTRLNNLTTIAGRLPDPDILPQPGIVRPNGVPVRQGPSTIVPLAKPDFFNDPDTQMAKSGDFELLPIHKNAALNRAQGVAEAEYDPDQIEAQGIRVIGTKFLPDRETAKVDQSQDRVQVQ